LDDVWRIAPPRVK